MTNSSFRPRALTLLAALLCTSALPELTRGQTLARPGWVGSGLTYQSWSKHAVIYEIDTRTFEDTNADGVGDLKGIAHRLDYIKALGVDAILLEPLAGAQSASPVPIDPALGTLEDFDELSLEASRLNLRILLDLPTPDVSLARFWLTRGVAGFHIPGSVSAPAVQPIRKLLPTFVGQRILITDADPGGAAVKLSANELVLDQAMVKPPTGSNAAGELRAALDQSQLLLRSGNTVLESDAFGVARGNDRFSGSGGAKDEGKPLAAALLLNRSVALIYAGQELGLSPSSGTAAIMPWGKAAPAPVVAEEVAPVPPKPAAPPEKFEVPDRYVPYVPPPKPVAPPKPPPPDPATAAGQDVLPDSLLNFYRALIRLHHGATALRDGEQITLNHDNANALVFVRRPPVPSLQTPAVFVVCNLSEKPLSLSLRADVINLRLRGSFLRKLLRSDDEEGSVYLDPISLPGFGVYVGELRY